MNIILFGGEGFIGQNLIDSLKTKYNLYSLSRNPSDFRKNLQNFVACNPYINTWDKDADVYIHLIDNKDYEEISLAEKIKEGAHLILFSSAVIYANPESDYAKRKIKIEKFYENYCENRGINLTILRLFNIYGYYQIPFRQGSLVANIFCNYLNGAQIKINNLHVSRDFIFALDVAKVIEKVIENKIFGTYDLATGRMIAISELIDIIKDSVGNNLKVEVMNGDDIPCPPAKNMIQCEFETLDAGISKTFKFYEKNIEYIRTLIV